MMIHGRASCTGSAQDMVDGEHVHTVSTRGSHGGEPEDGEIVDISQGGDSHMELYSKSKHSGAVV
jgi:hypothetical protein